jgi:hypothetical protein
LAMGGGVDEAASRGKGGGSDQSDAARATFSTII